MLCSLTTQAQVARLDSMNENILRAIDYKLTQDLYEHKYGYGEYNNQVIPLYFQVRKKAHYQAALALPLAVVGMLGANALANTFNNSQLRGVFVLITYVPLAGFGAFYTFNGVKESVRFTKKRLLQDLIRYKKTGLPSRQVQDYIDTGIN